VLFFGGGGEGWIGSGWVSASIHPRSIDRIDRPNHVWHASCAGGTLVADGFNHNNNNNRPPGNTRHPRERKKNYRRHPPFLNYPSRTSTASKHAMQEAPCDAPIHGAAALLRLHGRWRPPPPSPPDPNQNASGKLALQNPPTHAWLQHGILVCGGGKGGGGGLMDSVGRLGCCRGRGGGHVFPVPVCVCALD
jgi:hypothetical protein